LALFGEKKRAALFFLNLNRKPTTGDYLWLPAWRFTYSYAPEGDILLLVVQGWLICRFGDWIGMVVVVLW
jgi:hypothetical protein